MVSPSKAVKWLLKAKHSNWLAHFPVTHTMSVRVVSPICSYYFYATGDLNILLINALVLFVILQRVTLVCPSTRVFRVFKRPKMTLMVFATHLVLNSSIIFLPLMSAGCTSLLTAVWSTSSSKTGPVKRRRHSFPAWPLGLKLIGQDVEPQHINLTKQK